MALKPRISLKFSAKSLDPDTISQPEPEPSPLSQPSSSSHLKRTKGRKPTDGPPAKRKRVQQDASSDEEYNALSGDDGDLIIHTKRQSKLTAKAKANKGKSKSFTVGARDERKAGRIQQSNSTEAGRKARTKRTREASKAEEAEEEPVDVVNDTETRLDTRSLSPPKESAAPPAKRPKYPTIKKNKGAGAIVDPAPSSKTSSNAVTKSTVPKVSDLPKPPLAGSRVPPMMVGNTDFDLRDESVYKALFNQVRWFPVRAVELLTSHLMIPLKSGSNTSRSGLARQERRKELDKMRDEARAKRLSEMTPSFDLQSQYEKIKRFEESSGRRYLFPNVLASKWRDIYDAERRKAFMEQAWSSGGNAQEEGQARTHFESGRY
ncbi:hypothetical protein C0995_005069 [Termitomyces sp. Mi166|nr:hypothetical protein C0995_005069 [Termitomyces sp. Mi166\